MNSAQVQALKQQAELEVDRLRSYLIDMSRTIHENPEIAFQEHRSMALLADAVEEADFEVARHIGGLETAFRAVYYGNGAGPTIAFLAEYDALPKLGHACGHNLIGTSSMGAALAVRVVMDKLGGAIALLGTPAEERGGGKIVLLQNGGFDGIDMAMMVHPSTRTMTRRESLAASHIKLEFYGRAAHASSSPEHGINALDACIQTFNSVNALRQHFPSDVRIHGIITHGGTVANIVPDYAAAEFIARAATLSQTSKIADQLIQCAETAAKAMGAAVKVTREPDYAEMIPNLTMANLYARNISALGEVVVEAEAHESKASSDMGNVSHSLPAIQPHIKIAEHGIAIHTPEFREASISEQGHEGMIKVAKALAMTAIDILTDPMLVSKIQTEFEANIMPKE